MEWRYKMQKWEYLQIMDLSQAQQDFNPLGAEGWEMCGCFSHISRQVVCFFKRPYLESAPTNKVRRGGGGGGGGS
jgi:hypothetical protein